MTPSQIEAGKAVITAFNHDEIDALERVIRTGIAALRAAETTHPSEDIRATLGDAKDIADWVNQIAFVSTTTDREEVGA